MHALSGILLRAIPTFLLVVFLHFYLKYMFFKPLDKVLHARYEATEGARLRAAESLEKAAAKTAEYEAAMRTARAGPSIEGWVMWLASELMPKPAISA